MKWVRDHLGCFEDIEAYYKVPNITCGVQSSTLAYIFSVDLKEQASKSKKISIIRFPVRDYGKHKEVKLPTSISSFDKGKSLIAGPVVEVRGKEGEFGVLKKGHGKYELWMEDVRFK